MTKLTDTQALILSRASQHPGGLAAPPASLPPAPRGAVAKALLGSGLVEVLDSTEGLDATLAWKLDGEAVFLRFTAAGLRVIGVEADEGAQEAALAASGAVEPHDALDAAEPAQEAPTGAQEAGEVLAAWDDEVGDRCGLADAIAALRDALPQPWAASTPREPGAPRTPRTGTKQEAVLALLRRAEGASGPDMIEATGWAPHTVRGLLAGLKKRGFNAAVQEHVRQIGPGKEGAKGSYTV